MSEEVWVPAGTFWMGCNSALDSQCNANEHAQHHVTLSSYAIDRTEVTAAAYKACVTTGDCTLPTTIGGVYGTYEPVEKQTHPINYVKPGNAVAYCAWRGKRLCTEAEWERAARGGCESVTGGCQTRMRKYPWDPGDGTESNPPTCLEANFGSSDGPCESEGETAPVGSRPGGRSPYGAFDMSGNVAELVGDLYATSYPPTAMTDPEGPASGQGNAVRGGSFDDPAPEVRASRRYSFFLNLTTGAGYPTIGFRCCRPVP